MTDNLLSALTQIDEATLVLRDEGFTLEAHDIDEIAAAVRKESEDDDE